MVKDSPCSNAVAAVGANASEHPLQHKLEHFLAIVQGSDDAIISKTLKGIVTSWNAGAQSIFGYTEQEMLGKPLLVLFPPERIHEETYILQQVVSGARVDHFETVRLHKNGNRIDVSVTISPIRDNNGTIIGASKIARDITAEVATRARLRLISSAFTSTSEGILITGSDGLIVDVNDAFTRITGYSKGEVLGKDPQLLRSGQQSPSIFRAMRRSLMRFGEWKGEVWSRRKDGDTYSAFLTASRVCGDKGEVKNYVMLFSDITTLKLQREQLEHSAHFDALTDLPNRLLLSDRLHQAMANCQRHSQMLAVLFLDLDGFKAVNDKYGHDAGDELLIAVTHHMRAALREGDTLARMGGDEFVVVLTNLSNLHDCLQLVNRVLAACAQPIPVQGNVLAVTASIGVTLYPSDEADVDQLLRHADHAMYEAKRSGKNRFYLFDAVQDQEVRNLSLLQARIAQALHQREFVLHYQPKVNMRTGAIVGVEALIRWQHPERGLLAPGSFLPLIEKHPLCNSVGTWVLETALQQLQSWTLKGVKLPVSVNVSACQFQDRQFSATLADLLARHPQTDRGALELEILETSALDMVSVQKIISECHDLGVGFSLDDFGTGYSTLTYLRRLEVAMLKIDQSFIRDMLEDPGDLSIVKGVIGLASAFNRSVIAEGVETEAHGQQLLALGCELAQGYAIAGPMPADRMAPWVASWRSPASWSSL